MNALPLSSREPGPNAGQDAARLAAIRGLIAGEMAEVDRLVVARMDSKVGLIPELARHLVAAGGKRVRPMLTLLAAKLCGYEGRRQVQLATCVEFIHTATLLHDDVVDESDLRRGRSTANALWGNKAPVLVGDFLFSRAFQLMTEDGSLDVLRILSHASAVIAEGEVAQLMTANDLATDEAAYFAVIRAKTAALFRAAAEIGAVVAGRPATEAAALAAYGEGLGVAFQLVDDALDYSAHQALLGKTVGDDFRDGKVTLPVILAFQTGDAEERAFWRRALETGDQRPGDLAQAQALIGRHAALEATMLRAREAGATACAALAPFPDGPAKHAMLGLVDFCVDRAY